MEAAIGPEVIEGTETPHIIEDREGRGRVCIMNGMLMKRGVHDLEAFELLIQGAAADAQLSGGFGFVPVAGIEHFPDQPFFFHQGNLFQVCQVAVLLPSTGFVFPGPSGFMTRINLGNSSMAPTSAANIARLVNRPKYSDGVNFERPSTEKPTMIMMVV